MWDVALLKHQTKLISLKLCTKTSIKLFSAQDNKSNISSWIYFFFMITLKDPACVVASRDVFADFNQLNTPRHE